MSQVRRRNGDDDALGRGAHEASVRALIEAGFARLKIGEDHGSLAVGAKRALAGSFAMEKRGNGPSEHDAFLKMRRERRNSLSRRRLPGRGGDSPAWHFGSALAGQ